jgi:hypothetical protein
MKYHIDAGSWEHIYAFLDGVKGIHTNDEEALRFFIEAVWFGVRSGCP